MATELKLDRLKILSQLRDIKSISNDWALEYDVDVDQLFYGVKKIPKGYFLFQLNDEINLFVNKNSSIRGMFVEYFGNNYLEHNKELKPVLQVFEGNDGEPKKIRNIERLALEKDLLFSALSSLVDREELITAVA